MKIAKLVSMFLFFIISLKAEALVVTSLNIEWFGRGGEISGLSTDEYRLERIKEFIHEVLPASDIYAFQEITNKEALYQIMDKFECISYDAGTLRHQFVVLCSKKGLLKSFEVNHDVRLGSLGLRAALIGNYEIDGEITRVVGVHLKAGWRETNKRIRQVQELKKSINDETPTLVIGDFNTFKKSRTQLLYDDSQFLSAAFGQDFDLVENEIPTYMGFGGRVFDRAWVKYINKVSASVLGPCKEDSVVAPFVNEGFYNRFVSDHCALKIEMN